MASRRDALITFAVVVAAGVLAGLMPPLLKARDVLVATPAAPPLLDVTPVTVRPTESVCIGDVTLDPQAAIARFERVAGATAPAIVRVSAGGSGGYTATGRVTVPASAPHLDVPLTPRPQTSQIGNVCLRNEGASPLRLVGSTEPRSAAAARATIDGRPIAPHVALGLLEAHRSSLLARVPQILGHAAAFRPWWLGRGVLWVLLLGTIFGLPAGIAAALGSARRPASGSAPESGVAAEIRKSTP
jgi:hypothetical protein